MRTWQKALLGILIAGAAFFFILKSIVDANSWQCEVCLTFKGRPSCKSARGRTQKEARDTAIDSACAPVASGVTERMGCPSTVPDKLQCTQKR